MVVQSSVRRLPKVSGLQSGVSGLTSHPTVRKRFSGWRPINRGPHPLPLAARPTHELQHHLSHQINKISSSNHPKTLIFGESKEKALIYSFTKRDLHFPLIHLRPPLL